MPISRKTLSETEPLLIKFLRKHSAIHCASPLRRFFDQTIV